MKAKVIMKFVHKSLAYFQKKKLLLPVLVLVVVIIGLIGFLGLPTEAVVYRSVTESSEDFTLSASYTGDEKWQYEITGNISNQCVRYETSLEEQDNSNVVNITLFLYRAIDESLCAKRPQEVKEKGNFKAQQNVEVLFEVDEETNQVSPTGLTPKPL